LTPERIAEFQALDKHSLWPAIKECLAEIETLKQKVADMTWPAEFGWRCYQDRCEGALIEASVVKQLESENAALRSRLAALEPCVHEWGIDGAHANEYCKKCFIDRPKVEHD
jgi:hypothetical protein